MDRHGTNDRVDRGLGVHQIQNAVHDLVTGRSQDRGAQYLSRLGVDQHLHETLCLAFLDRASDPVHGIGADQARSSGLPGLRLRHADAPEWRIGVERIAG